MRCLCGGVLVLYRGDVVQQCGVDTAFATPQADCTRKRLAALPVEETAAHQTPAD